MSLRLLFLTFLFCSQLLATTVEIDLKNVSAVALTENTYVRFELKNYGRITPRVVGTNVILPSFVDGYPDANGLVSIVIQGNDTIFPANTYYSVCYFHNGVRFYCNDYLIVGTTADLSSQVPLSEGSTPPPAPTECPVCPGFVGIDNHNILGTFHTDSLTASVVRGDVVVGNLTPKWSRLALGTNGLCLKSDGTDVVWGTCGTGANHNLLSATHTDTTPAVGVAGDIVRFNSTWEKLIIGSAGQVLTVSGGLPSWQTLPAADSHNLLSATHTDTTALTPPVAGDLVKGTGGLWTKFARGSNGQCLTSTAGDIVWGSCSSASVDDTHTPSNPVSSEIVPSTLWPDNSTADKLNKWACGTIATSFTTRVFNSIDGSTASPYIRYGSTVTAYFSADTFEACSTVGADFTFSQYLRFPALTTRRIWTGASGHVGETQWDEDDDINNICPVITNCKFAVLRFSTSVPDTNWQCYINSATPVDTGVAPNTNWHKYEIVYDEDAPLISIKIDHVTVCSSAVNFKPSTYSGGVIAPFMDVTSTTGAAINFDFGLWHVARELILGP